MTYLSLGEGQWKGDVRIGQRKNNKWHGPNLYVWRGGNARFDSEVPQGSVYSNSTVNEVLPELRRVFNALSRRERLTAQRSMAKKGLYSSMIDGAWGRNTLIGLGRFSAEHLNTINLKSKRNIQLVLDGLLAQISCSKTRMAPLAILEKVAERDARFVKAASSSSNMKNAFIRESLLKRKQLQYALKQLGFYASGIDGLWGNHTASALTHYQSEESLLSSSSSQVFRRILNEVDVPSLFAAPKNNTTSSAEVNAGDGYTPYGPTRVPLEQAKDICELQAEAAYDSALENETLTDKYSGRCSGYGSYTSCTVGPDSYSRAGRSVGLLLGMALFGKENSPIAKRAKKVMKACMAKYG